MNRLLKNIVCALLGMIFVLAAIEYIENGAEVLRPVFDRRVMTVQGLVDEQGLIVEDISFFGDLDGFYRTARLEHDAPEQNADIDRVMAELNKLEFQYTRDDRYDLLFSVEFWGEIKDKPGYSLLDIGFCEENVIRLSWSGFESSLEEDYYKLTEPADLHAIIACFEDHWYEDYLGKYLDIEQVNGAKIRGLNEVMSIHYGEEGRIADPTVMEEWLSSQLVQPNVRPSGSEEGYYILTLDCIRNGKPETLEIRLWANQLEVDDCTYGIDFNFRAFAQQFTDWTPISE